MGNYLLINMAKYNDMFAYHNQNEVKDIPHNKYVY